MKINTFMYSMCYSCQTNAAMRNQLLFLGVVLLLVSIDVTSSYRVWRLAQANGHFAFCLYNKLIHGEDGHNAFFSPIRYDMCIFAKLHIIPSVVPVCHMLAYSFMSELE